MGDDAPADNAVRRPDDVAEEVDAAGEWPRLRPGLKLEPELFTQELDDPCLPVEEAIAVDVDEDEVVDIPQIPAGPELVLHELVQGIEVDVREELRRQVADCDAAAGR